MKCALSSIEKKKLNIKSGPLDNDDNENNVTFEGSKTKYLEWIQTKYLSIVISNQIIPLFMHIEYRNFNGQSYKECYLISN